MRRDPASVGYDVMFLGAVEGMTNYLTAKEIAHAELLPRPLSIPGEVVEAIREWGGWGDCLMEDAEMEVVKKIGKRFLDWLESHRAKE